MKLLSTHTSFDPCQLLYTVPKDRIAKHEKLFWIKDKDEGIILIAVSMCFMICGKMMHHICVH